jgi:hypothetical protein
MWEPQILHKYYLVMQVVNILPRNRQRNIIISDSPLKPVGYSNFYIWIQASTVYENDR